ncbi:DNA polymerase III subunit epsilon [Comamonas nitrativorans]|uniref:DNA polymerase III subunit epsilon n=1 Tax=Comamonas nitrativorans TaxID=108437 RepID=A0ABV9GXK8_9BURK
MQRIIVLDTETTGLSPENGDRVIELGCVELVGRKLTGNNLHLYFNPERDSHEDALRIHGLTTEFLSDKPKFAQKAQDILAYLQGAQLVIHNAPFDMGFLDKELSLLGLPPLKTYVSDVTDSLAMAKDLFPGKRNSLDALCDRLGVDNSGRTLHGALLDAELLADVYIYMTRGQHALLGDDGLGGGFGAGDDARNRIDLRQFALPILQATPHELTAHAEALEAIDKASNGKTIWRNLGVG